MYFSFYMHWKTVILVVLSSVTVLHFHWYFVHLISNLVNVLRHTCLWNSQLIETHLLDVYCIRAFSLILKSRKTHVQLAFYLYESMKGNS